MRMSRSSRTTSPTSRAWLRSTSHPTIPLWHLSMESCTTRRRPTLSCIPLESPVVCSRFPLVSPISANPHLPMLPASNRSSYPLPSPPSESPRSADVRTSSPSCSMELPSHPSARMRSRPPTPSPRHSSVMDSHGTDRLSESPSTAPSRYLSLSETLSRRHSTVQQVWHSASPRSAPSTIPSSGLEAMETSTSMWTRSFPIPTSSSTWVISEYPRTEHSTSATSVALRSSSPRPTWE